MKKIFTLIALCITVIVSAQNFQGKATYKTFRKVDFKMKVDGENSAMQKQIQEQLKKQFQQTYTLNFNKSESVYTQNKKLSAPQASMGGVQVVIAGNGGGTDVLYKNISDKEYLNKTEISGKRFLIKDKLEDYGWEMTSETKNIGNYTCYKATRSREETRTSMSVTDGKPEEKKEKVTVTTTAWYTPQIPVSNGPGEFWGLPGLILEIQDGKLTIACSEIVMNPSDKVEIKVPKKGKKVNQEEFDEIMDKHSKEMMERFRSKRKSKDGNSFSIEIQG
ncbi:GLPGLI family protein [Tenacibaculum sp. S7007]|uniref:GLPGLI family protein n=1 Tax=Tenacibaculum pelagium TaxID=2759527 RepID=A0A839AL76_9FLAO|nr:GLPGLI family protein [Tenacibaculum pelagium]MBA6155835.1 GLPGLI family protein [Tenacibaculum pelagium]